MKNITLSFVILFTSLGFLQAQQWSTKDTIDFETGGYGASWAWNVFENDTNPAVEFVANPDVSGVNTSATVAKITALQTGQPWVGCENQHGELGITWDLSDSNAIIKIMVYKTVISDVGFKLANPAGGAQTEIKVPNTVINAWEELTFDFSARIGNGLDGSTNIDQLVVYPDFDLGGRSADNVVYFDNITFNKTGGGGTCEDPTVAPPAPTQDAADVISVFSDAYTDIANTNFNPGWGQSTVVTTESIGGGSTLKYDVLNYQGTNLGGADGVDQDLSSMEYLHVDMWTCDATVIEVTPISRTTGEKAVSLTPINTGEWNSYDIPLSDFTGVSMADIYQMKFDGQAGTSPSKIFVDNIYFYKMGGGPDATLSDLQVDGTTIDGFSPAILNYSVELPEGTTTVPTVTVTENDVNASSVITPATAIPDTTVIVVTAQDGTTTKTYTVAFKEATGGGSWTTDDPIDFETAGFGASWVWNVFENATNPALEFVANPDASGVNTSATVAKITALQTGQAWAGCETAHGELGITWDLSASNAIIKIMVYKTVMSDVGIKLVNPAGGAQVEIKVANTVINAWEELTFDFSARIGNGLDGSTNIDQIVVFPDFDLGGRSADNVVYFDNISLNETGGVSTDATLSDLKVDGTTVDGFSSGILTYSVELPEGTTTVPTVTVTENDGNASSVITPAAAIPGSTVIVVTAQDGATTKTYTVDFTEASSVGISDVANENIKVYSHNGIIYVNSREELINGQIEIFGLTGQLIMSLSISNINEQISIHSKGLYIIRIKDSSDNPVLTTKLFLE